MASIHLCALLLPVLGLINSVVFIHMCTKEFVQPQPAGVQVAAKNIQSIGAESNAPHWWIALSVHGLEALPC